MSIYIVIPSRLGSTRLPEKALADIHGKPMVQHVFEKAKLVRNVTEVIVATDHAKIEKVVGAFGGRAFLTPESLQSGTDRVAFVAREMIKSGKAKEDSIFINVQGDEPMLDADAVEQSLELVRSGKFTMATPAAPFKDKATFENKNVVKVLVAKDKRAVYFSRYAIPYSRTEFSAGGASASEMPKHHLGVYVYTAKTLLQFSELPRCAWEAAESLEQLRALYHGIAIGVADAREASCGVDTQEDLDAVRSSLVAR